MSEKTIEVDLMGGRSIADIIMSHPMHPLKRWALKKMIPMSLWELPPQHLARLQKGDVIGKVSVQLSTCSAMEIGL